VPITGDGLHYLSRVLRLRTGDHLVAFDGRGRERRMRIGELSRDRALLLPDGDVVDRPRPTVPVLVLQALAKGDKMSRIVRACTELGVRAMAPITTARTIGRLEPERGEGKTHRLERIASEAARQCGRADVPEVWPVQSLDGALRALETSGSPWPLRVALWEGERGRSLREVLPAAAPAGLALLVGPEGGFAREEMERASGAGFVTASLGRRILRTETVAPALLAIVLFQYDP
jgi:16S rRNA (uracil1498-N3)-methyltransferase